MSIVEITPDTQVAADEAADEPAGRADEIGDTAPVGAEHDARAVTGARPSFTITEAATACAVSRKTITRKLTDLAELGAAKDDDGVWRIPVEALLAVGLHPGRSLAAPLRPARQATPAPALEAAVAAPTSARPTTSGPASTPSSSDTVTIARDRWDDIRLRLARAEAEASERALALADARLALRALTAGPAAPTPGWALGQGGPAAGAGHAGGSHGHPAGGGPTAPAPRKRRWWHAAAS